MVMIKCRKSGNVLIVFKVYHVSPICKGILCRISEYRQRIAIDKSKNRRKHSKYGNVFNIFLVTCPFFGTEAGSAIAADVPLCAADCINRGHEDWRRISGSGGGSGLASCVISKGLRPR